MDRIMVLVRVYGDKRACGLTKQASDVFENVRIAVDEATTAVPDRALEDGIKFERARCLAIAKGARDDYSGGYVGAELEAFKHGMQTVVNCLADDPTSPQVRTLEAIGRTTQLKELHVASTDNSAGEKTR